MKTSCIIKPTININGIEKDSKLFDSLLSYTNSRKQTIQLYSLFVTSEMKNKSGIVLDELGEPTLESLKKVFDLNNVLKNDLSIDELYKEIEPSYTKDNPIIYDNPTKAYDKANTFNNTHEKTVAVVNNTPTGYKIDLQQSSDANIKKREVKFSSALNKKLLGILNGLGFTVNYDTLDAMNGIFDPKNAETNANGLRTIIRIVQGRLGEEAFPEEFAHVMIAGLKSNVLVQRLLNSIDDDTIKHYLGDAYEDYKKQYNNNNNLLKEEVAGRILANHLKQKYDESRKSLIDRIWNFIKSMFSNIDESFISQAYKEANDEAGQIAEKILNDDILNDINKNDINNSRALYNIEKNINTYKKLCEDALDIMNKRIQIITHTSKKPDFIEGEKDALKKMNDMINHTKYTKSILYFLGQTTKQLKFLQGQIDSLKKNGINENDLITSIKYNSRVLRNIKDFKDGYSHIISQLQSMKLIKEENKINNLSDEDAEKIEELATNLNKILNDLDIQYKKLRFDIVYKFLKLFWGEDKLITMGKEKGTTLTLKSILEMARKDINGIDRWINNLASAKDPLLSLISKIVTETKFNRDARLNSYLSKIRAIHKKAEDAGIKTDFMYERDENGKLTGNLISDIDFVKFNKERDKQIKKWQDAGFSKDKIKDLIEDWERDNMEDVDIFVKLGIVNPNNEIDDEKNKKLSTRYEKLPKASIYGMPESKLLKNRLTSAQLEYYTDMLKLKANFERLIPKRYSSIYRAIQIRNDVTEAISNNITDPKQAAKILGQKMADDYLIRVDDVEYGDLNDTGVKEKYKKVLTNMKGQPLEQLPIYFTQRLEDTERLSTDFTRSILAYAGMALNYDEMNKVIDVLELTRDLVHDRKVNQFSGDRQIIERSKFLSIVRDKIYTKLGSDSGIGGRIDDFYSSAIYNKRKKEGSVSESGVSTSKIIDKLNSITVKIGLGFNPLQGAANLINGDIQQLIEACAVSFVKNSDNNVKSFGIKNLANGKKWYYKDLPKLLAEANSVVKTSKLALLMEKFDATEDFFNSVKERGYYNSAVGRLSGNSNILMMFNNAGEHNMHGISMLAMMDAYKVLHNGKEISLYEAYDVVKDDNNVYTLKLKDNITNLDGTPYQTNSEFAFKRVMHRVNQDLYGAFGEDARGALQQFALGRMVMVFRQWMPEFYNRRFSKVYYDFEKDETREGFNRTMGRFLKELTKDLRHFEFNIKTHWEELSNSEKENISRALTEYGIYGLLLILLMCAGGEGDHKGDYSARMAIYLLKRAELEMGAVIPYRPVNVLKNTLTIIKSPTATTTGIGVILGLFDIPAMYHEIETGRYKGWTEWERNAFKLTGALPNVMRAIDVGNEDYMFTIYNK